MPALRLNELRPIGTYNEVEADEFNNASVISEYDYSAIRASEETPVVIREAHNRYLSLVDYRLTAGSLILGSLYLKPFRIQPL